jgi:UDP-N-acetylmuramyl pentapeptide phosphotransferase/UDP-N-acetylglucosamine-1-phosphate transferase
MKFGGVEGTPEEIKDHFENNGLNPLDFFVKPEDKLSKVWVVVPCVIIILCFGILNLIQEISDKTKLFIFLIGLSSCVWAAVSVHIRFKSGWGAGSIIFIGLLAMLVALGILQPVQLLDYIEPAK